MKLNRTELLRLAHKKLILAPPNSSAEELLGYLRKERDPPTENPERELRATMMTWVLRYWDQICAQHLDGEPDCIVCPIGKLLQCFLHNRRNLQTAGLLFTEDPWLRK